MTVTLTGTNFVAGATVVNVDGAGATASDVVVVNPTSLTASVVLDPTAAAGAAHGHGQDARRTQRDANLHGHFAAARFRQHSPIQAASKPSRCPPASSRSPFSPQAPWAAKETAVSTGLPLGMGGRTTATVSVLPGVLLTVRVGGSGPMAKAHQRPVGSTAVARAPETAVAAVVPRACVMAAFRWWSRAAAAAAGVFPDDVVGSVGGAGGGLTAATGGSANQGGGGGGGGTQAAGGAGGTRGNPGGTNGTAGVAGTGGTGGVTQVGSTFRGGGGGGGGYFGGGGGGGGGAGFGDLDGGAGGGGSSFAAPGATGVVHEQGVNSGNGSVTISW